MKRVPGLGLTLGSAQDELANSPPFTCLLFVS